jgi:hypothetical protein
MSEARKTVLMFCARCGKRGAASLPRSKPKNTWHLLLPLSEAFYERVRSNGLGTEVACFDCETNVYPVL